jgi:hypothetical protein
MNYITWEEALKNPSFANGEIEVQETDKIYRGPIKEIRTKGDDVYFHLLWCGHYDMSTDKWSAAEHETAVIFKKSITTVTPSPDGRFLLQNPEIIIGIIFPEGGNRLNPDEVEGLDLDDLSGPQVVDVDFHE